MDLHGGRGAHGVDIVLGVDGEPEQDEHHDERDHDVGDLDAEVVLELAGDLVGPLAVADDRPHDEPAHEEPARRSPRSSSRSTAGTRRGPAWSTRGSRRRWGAGTLRGRPAAPPRRRARRPDDATVDATVLLDSPSRGLTATTLANRDPRVVVGARRLNSGCPARPSESRAVQVNTPFAMVDVAVSDSRANTSARARWTPGSDGAASAASSARWPASRSDDGRVGALGR